MKFNIVQHDVFTEIRRMSFDDMVSAFKQAVDLVYAIKATEEIFNEYDNDKDRFALDNLIDDLDAMIPVSVSNLEMYGVAKLSIKSPAINKSVTYTMQAKASLDSKINKLILAGVALSDSNREFIDKKIKKIIGCVTYFLCYEFDLYELCKADESGNDEAELNAVYSSYCQLTEKDPVAFAKELRDLSLEYRVSFGVFVDYPELELPFMELVGPDINLINEETLTLEQVVALLDGKVTLEQFLDEVSIFKEEIDIMGEETTSMNSF